MLISVLFIGNLYAEQIYRSVGLSKVGFRRVNALDNCQQWRPLTLEC